MAKKPLLIFPRPTLGTKSSKPPGRGNLHFPTSEQQIERLDEAISNLDLVLKNQNAYLGLNPANLVTEMILVLEIAGFLDDFFKAVAETPGMEFLAEYREEVTPDQNFYTTKNGVRVEKPFGARLFLTMTNQRALRELLSYWNEYKKPKANQNFRNGTTKFRTLFEQLIDIRPYSVQDRLKDTGMELYLQELGTQGRDNLNFEVELAYKKSTIQNDLAFNEISQLLRDNGGQIIPSSRVIIPEIQYHAFIANAPFVSFQDLTNNTQVSFLKCQQVLYFRPVGQSILRADDIVDTENEIILPQAEILGEPVIALLDGLPLQNHSLLTGKIIIDDPENFGLNYLAESRMHGTSMASLIVNGDLNIPNPQQLSRPIYIRPIMKSHANGFGEGEFLPDDKLPIDLIHRALVRMFDGEGGNPPSARNVKIINLSIGDSYRPFNSNMSTWAKLIDWLSFKYNVLFVISAGNQVDDLTLDCSEADFNLSTPEDIQKLALANIVSNDYNRKILSPSESINAITVGASHSDLSILANTLHRKNVISSPFLMSPISRIGFGYNQSIKPEILMPGGIKLFRKPVVQRDPSKTLLTLEGNYPTEAPGQIVAIPGSQGNISNVGYSCGTSNSTALTTRLAGQLFEMLMELNAELPIGTKINPKYFTVIIKSLLAHGANWGEAQNILTEVMNSLPGRFGATPKRLLFPYVGYGCVDSDKILYCTDQRVTLIGFGELSKKDRESAHLYRFPLPPSIAAARIDKKLVITLAWLSPINFNTSKYRKAHIFFENMQHNTHISITRPMYDYDAAQKGTLQHDILTGNNADAFIDGDMLEIKVNCRADASGLSTKDKIAYGICVTLEIQENHEARIYDEVQTRLRPRVRQRT
jgi:hypothetical protein